MPDAVLNPTIAQSMARIIVLLDGRAGTDNQTLAVAKAYGEPFSSIMVQYNVLASLPNRLCGARLWHLKPQSQQAVRSLNPVLVFSAGRRLAPVALWLKAKTGCRLCHLMRPDMASRGFDLLAIPAHDAPEPAPNVLRIAGAPHNLTAGALSAARQKWKPLLTSLPAPRVAVLVGGDSRHGRLTPAMATALGQSLAEAVAAKGSLMLTTSRRTSPAATDALLAALGKTPRHQFLWGQAGENPYHGYLANADAIVVTEDSVSMLWEALSVGKGVYIFHFGNNSRFDKFTKGLYDHGLARRWPAPLTPWTTEPLHVAEQVAARLRLMG